MRQETLGAILDIDGTLIDSNDARCQAWLEAFTEFGHPFKFKDLRPLVGLVPHDMLTRHIGMGEDTPTGQAIRDRYLQIFRRRFEGRLVPFLRARDLLVRMRDAGLRIVLATPDPPDVLLPLLRSLSAEALLHRAAMPTKGVSTLTNRDLIKSALDRLGVPAQRTALLADAPFDLDAGAKLGLVPVAIRSNLYRDEELASATAIYDSTAHLYDDFETSPLAGPVPTGRAA
jgi:phosphoglycolate phosphatase-like HAD superfamily hydrolase